MMSRVDMFCAGDDRHRVALLEDLLQQAGVSVVLHTRVPERPPSDPCIVACTGRALKKPWILELFSGDAAVVALRLDDTPLPGPCSRVIDMQSWPARSADRNVGALVDWLIRQGHGTPAGSGPGPALPAGAGDSLAEAARAAGSTPVSRHQDPPPAAAIPRRRRLRSGASEARRVLVIVTVLIAGGVLLWSSRPEPGGGAGLDDAAAEQESMLEVPAASRAGAGAGAGAGAAVPADSRAPPGNEQPDAAVPARSGDGTGADGAASSATVRAVKNPRTPPADGSAPASAGSPGAPGRVDTAAHQALPPAGPAGESRRPGPESGHADALAHLCAANSLQAARAWAAALNWKQRRRAAEEACVGRLLARPGYRVLAPLLRPP